MYRPSSAETVSKGQVLKNLVALLTGLAYIHQVVLQLS